MTSTDEETDVTNTDEETDAINTDEETDTQQTNTVQQTDTTDQPSTSTNARRNLTPLLQQSDPDFLNAVLPLQ